ncbi:MAG: tetratricopeptide repeat protein [Cyclobacteriaceae bacterium]
MGNKQIIVKFLRQLHFFLLILITFSINAQSIKEQLYEEALRAYNNREYLIAESKMRELIEMERSVDNYFLQSSILEALDKKSAAISALTKLLAIDDTYLEAVFKRGQLFYEQGVYKQAIDDFTQIIEWPETPTKAIFFRIDTEGDGQVKVGSLETMKAQVYSLRGMAHQAMGDMDQAKVDLDQALRLAPDAEQYMNRGLLYFEMGDLSMAEQDLKRCVEMDNRSVRGWFNLLVVNPNTSIPDDVLQDVSFAPLLVYRGVDALNEDRLGEARTLFYQALKVKLKDPLLLMNIGRLEDKEANHDEAVRFFAAALAIDPAQFDAYYLLGNTFYKKGEYLNAAEAYERYLAHDRSNGQIWYNAGITYHNLEEFQTSCLYLDNAIERGMNLDRNSSLFDNCSN